MFLSSGESIIFGTFLVRDRSVVNECLKLVSISYSQYMLRRMVMACVLWRSREEVWGSSLSTSSGRRPRLGPVTFYYEYLQTYMAGLNSLMTRKNSMANSHVVSKFTSRFKNYWHLKYLCVCVCHLKATPCLCTSVRLKTIFCIFTIPL